MIKQDVQSEQFLSDEELAYWLAFDQLPGIGLGGKRVRAIHKHLESLATGWRASKAVLKYVEGLTEDVIDKFIEARGKIDPQALLEKLRAAEVNAYPICHAYYPALLREIYDPPCVLYARGQLIPSDLPCAIGVVGTRRPTAYGQRLAKEFAHQLAASGATVVSGMAYGVDSLAHRGALEAGGRTVAVLGCGPDVCYPSSNRPLYNMLCEDNLSLVVSEFFPGTQPDSWRFPARNRIISGMSKALLVIEAGEQSGALITAHMAFEQNRQVFAIPGRIDSPMSAGTNRIINRLIAQLVTSVDDILKNMHWAPGRAATALPTMVELFGHERDLYELLSNEPVHFDVLCERTGIPAGELSATLTMLELAGVVSRLPGDWYTRQM